MIRDGHHSSSLMRKGLDFIMLSRENMTEQEKIHGASMALRTVREHATTTRRDEPPNSWAELTSQPTVNEGRRGTSHVTSPRGIAAAPTE